MRLLISVVLLSALSFVLIDSAPCDLFGFASYYASYMVLQRGPVRPRIWGYADAAGDDAEVELGQLQTVSATAVDGPDGLPVWEVVFDAIPDGEIGPLNITAHQRQHNCRVTLVDVMVGDVWLCSGQSNMEFQLQQIDNPQPDIDDVVNYPNVRTFHNARVYSDVPLNDLQSVTRNWAIPTTANMPSFSALCWLFGRHMYNKLGYPIGLIETNWGGTRIEAWSSPDALQTCFGPGGPPPGSNQNNASALWNAMINPFLPMPIYGAIWYQGESNSGNADMYGCALNAMVTDWRTKWNAQSPEMDSVFPFGQVQLAPWKDEDIVTGFPDVRWWQTDGFGYTPNTNLQRIFTAVAMDLPDYSSPSGSIHPRFKRQIADRLSLGAFVVAYGFNDTGTFQGPLPIQFDVNTNTSIVRVTYDSLLVFHAATGFELCCSTVPDAMTCDESSGQGMWMTATPTSFAPNHLDLQIPCAGSHRNVIGFRYAWRESPCDFEACAVYASESNQLPAPPYLAFWAA